MFQGFSQATSDFLWDLKFNNERSWFNEHKSTYETALHAPFRALGDDLLARLKESYPSMGWTVHYSRIYRDARRLFGRGPFKDHLWFTLQQNDLWRNGPVFWFEISAARFSYGFGCYAPRPDMMDRFRKGIAAHPARFERLAKQAVASGRFVVEGEEYKRPKGDLGPVINPWYNRKYVSLCHEEDFGGDLFHSELVDRMEKDFKALMPVYDYFLELYFATGDFADLT